MRTTGTTLTKIMFTGTGSTHSGGSGSTHSADSGIPEEEPRLRVKYSESVPKPRRPESAVPSEYSVVSDSSSCEGSEDKAGPYSERTPVREVVSEGDSEVIVREASDESEEASGREEERRERLRRAHAIATELLDTEKHYVAILHLIDQVIIKLISAYHSLPSQGPQHHSASYRNARSDHVRFPVCNHPIISWLSLFTSWISSSLRPCVHCLQMSDVDHCCCLRSCCQSPGASWCTALDFIFITGFWIVFRIHGTNCLAVHLRVDQL